MNGQSILRNLFHFSGIVIPLVYLFVNRSAALGLTVLLFVALLPIEYLRISGRLNLGSVQRYLKPKEGKKPTGSFFYVVAVLITILLFERRAVIPSLFILSIADPLSSLIGWKLGKHPLLGKSLEGTCAFFISSVTILTILSVTPSVAIPVAFIATMTELLTPRFLDDNLTIPIVTGGVLTLLAG